MSTLSDIRFITERLTKTILDDEDVIIWCNEVNADVGTEINLPGSEDISLLTTEFSYTLPTNLKIINRLNLQSLIDEGKDREWNVNFRIYNGEIILPNTPFEADTLVLDYYKNLTYHTLITESLDLPERFNTLYTSYGMMKHLDSPMVREIMGETQARLKQEAYERMYNRVRIQVISTYSLSNEPTVIDRGF